MKSRLYSIVFILIALFSSCKKDDIKLILSSDANIIAFTLVEQMADIEILENSKSVNIGFTSDVIVAEDFYFEFILSEGASARIGSTAIESGLSEHDFEAPFRIDVTAEDQKTVKAWNLIPSNGQVDQDWGLGSFQKQSVSNNRDYDWYLDQANTGTYSGVNCGPTTTTMAAKWSNKDFVQTPEDARSAYRPEGGWWFTSDIDNYLSDNSINHHFVSLSDNSTGTQTVLKQNIDAGNIAIICLDMYYIRNAMNSDHHVDKFYNTSSPGWGHFFVVKGYKEVDNRYLFEIYDPYCYSQTYSDGSFKGKDRYYRANDLFEATSIWWNYSIILTAPGVKSSPANALDPSTIPHAWGR